MKRKIVITLFSIVFGGGVYAQSVDALNTYTPYTLFGIGEISKQGTSFNKAMGGIGIGIKDHRYINYLNPASLTFRDTMSFMTDFGVEQKNLYSADANTTSAFNTFNMNHFVVSFPTFKNSALMLGVVPFSDVGYKFNAKETDPEIINTFGDISYQKYGVGGISKVFAGTAYKFGKNLSLGIEADYYFGTIDKNSNIYFNTITTNRTILTGWDYVLGGFGFKAGILYNKPLNNEYEMAIGATYSMGTRMSGDVTRFAKTETSGGTIDTTYMDTRNYSDIRIPSEFGMGISVKKGLKWLVGADFVYQDWSGTQFPETQGINFSGAKSSQFKAGFEYTPNRYDVRYYLKKVSYRAGLYYENSYMNINGNNIKSMGITFGANLPIYELNNAVGLAVDMGQRGSIKNNLVRERYIMFIINIHLHDIWFKKFRYN
jgi:long-subunit fatty acid transport protein